VCGACSVARSRGRLHLRLEALREKRARGLPLKQVRRVRTVPALGVGCRVMLLCEPPEHGCIVRPEREGWVVRLDCGEMIRVYTKELKALPRLENV
jgi:hypothetical protein